MGNLIVTTASVGIPLFTQLIAVPFVFHPYRWGGMPWKEPSQILVIFFGFILNLILLSMFGTLSGMMTTENACHKHSVWKSFKRSFWVILGYIIGNIVVFLLPMLSAPLLAVLMWLPYAGIIVRSLLTSIFILIFGAMGNTVLRNEVC